MTEIRFVKLCYGPYIANGVMRHKTQRLHGIIQCLSKLGYDIEIVPTIHINRLSVEMYGREIYRCNINNLQFNIECTDDVICKRLVAIVEEASTRLYAESSFPRYHPITRGKRIIQEIKNAKTTQDLFSSDIKLWYEIPRNSFVDSLQNSAEDIKEEN